MIPYYDFNHAPAIERFQKNFDGKTISGKGVIDVSHTVDNAFSIVKRPQRGAVVNLTICMIANTRESLCRDEFQASWGVGRYPGRVPRELSYSTIHI